MLLKRFLLIFALCCLGLTAVWSTTRSLTAAPSVPLGPQIPPSDWVFQGIQSDAYQGQVVVLGDIDGNGFDDLVVGEPYFDEGGGAFTDTGRVLIFMSTGSVVPPNPTRILTPPPGPGSINFSFGSAIALGNFSEDGALDLAIGAPGYSNNETHEGAVYVYDGSNIVITPTILAILESNQAEAAFGSAVTAVPALDVFDNDELLVGAPLYGDTTADGAVFLYQTTDSVFPTDDAWFATGLPNSRFGHALSASDFANDTDADLIVGAPYATDSFTHEGAVHIFNVTVISDVITINSTPDHTHFGGEENAEFGYSVLGGFISHPDFLGDVLIGAPGFQNGTPYSFGAVYLFTDPFETAPAWMAFGQTGNSRFGTSLAVGNFDDDFDGTPDILVGSPRYGTVGSLSQGAVYVYLQNANIGFDSDYDWKLFGEKEYDLFGTSIALGDVDLASGHDDLLVGAPGWDDETVGSGYGKVYLYYGRSSTPISDTAFTVPTDVTIAAGTNMTYQATLLAGSNIIIEWKMGNGESYVSYGVTAPVISVITHTYHTPGNYLVTVRALVPHTTSMVQKTFMVHVVDPIEEVLFTNNSPVRFNPVLQNGVVRFTIGSDTSSEVEYSVAYGDDTQDIFTRTNGTPFFAYHTYGAPGYYLTQVSAYDGTHVVQKTSRVRVVRALPLGPDSGGSINHMWSNNRPFVVDVPTGTVQLENVELIFNPVSDASFGTPFPDEEDLVVRGPLPTPLNNPVFFDLELTRDLDLQCFFLPIINTSGTITPTTGTGVQSPCVQEITGTFDNPVEYTFKYNLEDLPIGTTPQDLRFFFFDETNGIWVDGADTCTGGSVYVVDIINQTITLPICHQSRWGVGAG